MSDVGLVLAARAGDERAFEQLLDSCRGMLHAIAGDFYAPGSDQDDLRQAAAIGLVQAVRDWRPEQSVTFRSFLHLCARRQVITAVITARRMKHDPLNEGVSFEFPVADDAGHQLLLGDTLPDRREDAHASLVARETLALVFDAIRNDLTELERDVLIRFVNGATLDEIEAAVTATTGRVSTALHPDGRPRPKITENALQRARVKLRLLLDEDPRPLGVAA